MRKLINLIEGSVEPLVSEGVADLDTGDFDFAAEIERQFSEFENKMQARRQVEDVYLLVLDGIPFEDAVGHIAKRSGMDALDLRSACVDDYKVMRANGSTYDYSTGHALVNALNPVIREAIEASLK